MWCVYILKSTTQKWYYVGSTNRPQDRLKEHNLGKVLSTKAYRPYNMVYIAEFASENAARCYERLLKDKRIEKEKLIKLIENK